MAGELGRQASGSLAVYLMLLFAVTAWGASFVAARVALDPVAAVVAGAKAGATEVATLTPVMLAATRLAIASVVLLPVLIHQHRRVRRIDRRDAAAFVLLGQLAVTAYFWLQYQGVRLTNAGVSSVLVVGLIPITTLLVSAVVERTRLGWKKALGTAMGFAGVALVAGQRSLTGTDGAGFVTGSLCLVADAACFAVYTVMVRRLTSRYPPLETTAAINVSGAAGLLLLAVVEGKFDSLGRLAVVQWVAVAYLSMVCTLGAYFCYNCAVHGLGAEKAAAWIYLEPLVATILGVSCLGETLTVQTIAGGAVILASVCLAHRA